MKVCILYIVSFLLISTSVFANDNDFWGQTGHRATGRIAQKHLTKKAKKMIDRLLNGQSLAFVSTYADEIKSDKSYNKFYSWHYVNFPLDGSYETSEKNKNGDIITGIKYCVNVLKNKENSQKDKVFYLKLLVHLVGDLHQPMHIGQKEDKGGNLIKLKWFQKGSNLHRVWDSNMIDSWNMGYVELADSADRLSKNQINAIKKGSVLDWAHETHKITKKVYASTEAGKNLSYRYSYDYFPVVRQQLQKGGIRLAKLLNEIFA